MMSPIRSAVMRMTLFYLAILTLISVSFSVVVYDLSSRELDRSMPGQVLRELGGRFFVGEYEQRWLDLMDESQARLKQRLVLWNIVIIGVGAVGSYWFARRTLEPIDGAMERQGQFISDASHELRTPLTAMMTETEVGLRDPNLTIDEAKQLLESNLEEAKRLSGLTTNLLELSSGRQHELVLEPVALAEAASRAIQQVEPARAKRGTVITSTITGQQVLGDPQRLEELLVILLDNAIKYSDKKAQVTLATKKHGRTAILTIRDSGIGIAPTDLPHIFDRFYRADASRSTRHIDGHGLGLSIARQIVESHGGQITATSKVGQGTTFTVKLQAA
jgi:signal transduction histidine kinase